MSLLKYIERLKRMDDLIRRRATGSAREFSEKLDVSQSQLFLELREMKELGAPIEYCPRTRTYYYVTNCRLILDFKDEGRTLKGGHAYAATREHGNVFEELRSSCISQMLKGS